MGSRPQHVGLPYPMNAGTLTLFNQRITLPHVDQRCSICSPEEIISFSHEHLTSIMRSRPAADQPRVERGSASRTLLSYQRRRVARDCRSPADSCGAGWPSPDEPRRAAQRHVARAPYFDRAQPRQINRASSGVGRSAAVVAGTLRLSASSVARDDRSPAESCCAG